MVTVTSSLPETGGINAKTADAWVESLAAHRGAEEVRRIGEAVQMLAILHGETYAPGNTQWQLALLQTGDILDQLKLDSDTLIAGLLSEATGSPAFDREQIAIRFGPVVLKMIEDMAIIREVAVIGGQDSGGKQTENLRRMLLGLADDVRVVLVVLAKRLRLMRVLKYLQQEDQRQVAAVTQRIHAPLANRLGVWQLKWELEDLSLRYLHPESYQQIAQNLEGKREERESFIREFIDQLHHSCSAQNIPAEMTGRPKHIYSIWKKMHRKSVDFSQIFDVRAVRVLVDTVAHCYEVLGIVHGTWQPIPGEFDDYIARPKANGYASLHTAVVGEDGKPMEVQIRTREMHEHAERGVAAHWRYKESRGEDMELERRIEWMRGWLEQNENKQPGTADDKEFDTEFEARRIYVLTPHGKVIELPKGATAVDFAYAIHSSVGDRCRGAKADGKMISLTQPLESGQNVEIITIKEGGPSRDWLNTHSHYVVTSRAKNRIRQWFKRQDHDQHVNIGKASLEKELARLGVRKLDLNVLLNKFNYKHIDDLYAGLGRGDISPIQVANVQLPAAKRDADSEIPQKAKKRAKKRPVKEGANIMVEGVGDLMTHMARCCKPVPFDSIIGYITRGRGVTIHRKDCGVVHRMDDEQLHRLIPVAWSEDQPQSAFLVDIHVFAADRKGLLRDVTSVFSNEEIDVLGVKTQTDRHKEKANMRFTVEVENISQLSRVLEKLDQVPDVLDVRRQV